MRNEKVEMRNEECGISPRTEQWNVSVAHSHSSFRISHSSLTEQNDA
jgi:hypothetical protein